MNRFIKGIGLIAWKGVRIAENILEKNTSFNDGNEEILVDSVEFESEIKSPGWIIVRKE